MNKPIIDPADRTAAIAAIKQLAADDLRFLNAAMVDQLKALRAASYAENMAQFSVDDRVVFTDKTGERRSATILKLNKKTVGVITDDEEHWKVAPQLLELEVPPENNNVFDFVPGGRPNVDVDLQQDLPFGAVNGLEYDEQAETYLASGADPSVVGEMFKAAAGLYRAAPWNTIPHDQCLIGISIPDLGIEDGVLVIVGKMQQNCGFLFFSTLVEHEHYLLASDYLQRGLEADMPSYIALTYEAGADIKPALRKQIAGQGWEVADTSAYPEVFIADVARAIRPMSPRDIRLITLLCGTLPELFETVGDTQRAWLSDARLIEYPCFMQLADELDGVRFSVPYPYQEVLHIDRTSSALIARLMVLGRSSDDIDLDAMQPLAADLEDGFRQSPESNALGETRIGISSLVIEIAAGYLNETIATLLPVGLEQILLDIFPRKVAIGPEHAETCINDLRAFYQYLKREHGLIQADACLDFLTDKCTDALAEALADDSEFDFGKGMLEIGKKLGYDTV